LRTALFPGSFDPFHNGHLEIVERAAALFDQVVVVVISNPQKADSFFDLDERKAMVTESTSGLGNVRAMGGHGLVVDVAKEVGATAIVKGIRAWSDFESEMQQAQMNHSLSGIDTVFLPTGLKHSFVASRLLKEVAKLGGDVSPFVPESVAARIDARLRR